MSDFGKISADSYFIDTGYTGFLSSNHRWDKNPRRADEAPASCGGKRRLARYDVPVPGRRSAWSRPGVLAEGAAAA